MSTEIYLKGSPICVGVVIGSPYYVPINDDKLAEYDIGEDEINYEINRFKQAVKGAREDIAQLVLKLEQEGSSEGAEILQTHLQMIDDPFLTNHVETQIQSQKRNCEAIFTYVIQDCEKRFKKMKDMYFRERFVDLEDVYERVIQHLRCRYKINWKELPENTILFARKITPSDVAEADFSCVKGFVTELGGETSHAAIMAKSKGIPYVCNLEFNANHVLSSCSVVLDARDGTVILNPSQETLHAFQVTQQRLSVHLSDLHKNKHYFSQTIDGYPICLSANIEIEEELPLIHQNNADGIGLFRSEYLFFLKNAFPSEEEQYRVYKQMIEQLQDKTCVIRTFDIGGDKLSHLQKLSTPEHNPFLGCRAIRFLLKEKDIFKKQLRAILRASRYGQVNIMFPMVSSLPELTDAKKLLEEVKQDLQKEGIEYDDKIPIGCMIEVPSAVLICDVLAKECDFFSIGTNDLIQYALAVDRCNEAMSYLYKPSHPSVIRAIKMVVSEAHRNGIPVSVCGEIAADPRFTALLLGLGIDELSVSPKNLPMIKNSIRHTSIVEASQLAENILRMSTASDIMHVLIQSYEQSVPNDCFYNL